MKLPADENVIKSALVELMRQGVGIWDVLEGVAYGLSLNGYDRRQIVRFFSDFVSDSQWGLTGEQSDLVTDITMHLIGQCNVTDIIRLAGDPEDLDGLVAQADRARRGG